MAISTAEGTTEAQYTYNPLGQRTSKTLSYPDGRTEVHHYLYNLQGQLITEVNTTELQTKHTLYLNNQPVAVYSVDEADEGTPWIIDNTDSTTSSTGSWPSSSVNPPYGADSQYSGGESTFTWQTTIPQNAFYRIEAWWTAHHQVRSQNAEYRFTSTQGNELVTFSHQTDGGKWNSLGNYTLPAGTLDITLQNKLYTVGSVSADAIRITPLNFVARLDYIHNDHLNTPQLMTDTSQNIVWQAQYDAFGDAEITTETVTNNLRFPGQYFDQETRLHYNWFRYYNSQIGRYTQSDPIGLDDGPNTYLYAQANPLRYTDPTGLFTNACFGPGCWFTHEDSRPDVDVGVSGTIGSTTVSYGTNNPNVQWGQTTQLGVGAGGSICFNLPDPPEQSASENSCPIDSPSDDGGIFSPDNYSSGFGKNLGGTFNSDGSFCINIGPSIGLPGGAGWDIPD